jgi:GT2 family glycosyltransferase
MDLSIIIVSYNTKKLTLECIKSIFVNKDDLNLEVIVVDNNSKDGSFQALKQLEKDKKIILIKNKKNLGFSKANNQGIKKSKGKHVLLLNSDTLVKDSALKKMYDFAEENNDAGVVGSRLLNDDGSVQESCLHFPTIKNAIKEYWLGKEGLFEKYAPDTDTPVKVDAVVGASFLITQKALNSVGLLNEKYFFYFEDIDYCRSIKQRGLSVYYLPSAEIVHYHGASGKSIASEKNQWKRLIPSSKLYHGNFKHIVITGILWLGQKWKKLFKSK